MILLLYQVYTLYGTSKDIALFCFTTRITYHGYTMCPRIRSDNVLLLWSTSLPGLTRYIRQLMCKRLITLDDRA